jgi:RHS repeat-associated protein
MRIRRALVASFSAIGISAAGGHAYAANWTSDTHVLAPGDFNNDGRSDLLVIAKDASEPSGIALGDIGTNQPSVFHQSWASNWLGIDWSGGTYIPHVGDFNGDTYDDVFLQRTTGGNHYVLLTDPTTKKLTAIHQTISNTHLAVNWSAAERRIVVGDFNNTAEDDLFLQANAPGVDNVVALGSYNGPFQSVSPPTPWANEYLALEWSLTKAIEHAGDFNNDGNTDWFVHAKPNWALIPFDDLSIPVPVYRPESYGIVLADGTGRAATVSDTWNHDYLGFEWSPLHYDAFVGNFDGQCGADILLQAKRAGDSSRIILVNCSGQVPSNATVHVLSAGVSWDQQSYQLQIGDFDGNGRADIYMQALTGATNRIAYTDSYGNVTTTPATHAPSGNFKKPVPGAIPASFGVADQGAGTYTMPIAAPAGTGGLKPNLALSYNHMSGNGLAGMRWTLAGIGAITRCQQTYGQDTVNFPITYTSTDRFCINGQRLISTGATYGADGTIYRAEIDTLEQVVQVGMQGGGPLSFRVDHGNGVSSYYGATPDSRIEVPGGSAVRIWYLSYTEDRFGNRIRYTYNENSSTGESYPTEVAWTERSGLSPMYKISIAYEARPADDQRAGYDSASKQWANTQRIDRIDVTYNSQLINSYELSYAAASSGGTGRSRLERVDLCGLTECMGATVFGVQSGTAGWGSLTSTGLATGSQSWVGDLNRDGKKDVFVVSASNTWQIYPGNSNGLLDSAINTGISAGPNPWTAQLVDANSDGRTDILYKSSSGVWRVLTYNGSTFSEWVSSIPNTAPDHAIMKDVNGDGLRDWVYRDGVNIGWRQNHGNGTFSPAVGTLASIPGFSLIHEDRNVSPPDFNGDGRDDLINFGQYCEPGPEGGELCTPLWTLMVAAGNPAWGSVYNVYSTFASVMGYFYDDVYNLHAIDLNGDGLDDLAFTRGPDWYTQLSTGTGFTEPVATGIQWVSGQLVLVADYDNDGRQDLLRAEGDYWRIHRSNGATLASTYVSLASVSAGLGPGGMLADLSGDGFPELIRAYGGVWQTHKHQTALPDVATTFTDGLGHSIGVQYASLANTAHYAIDPALTPTYPYTQLLTKARYVVTSESHGDGIGGTRDFAHYYDTAFTDVSGRNWTSFAKHKVNDLDQGVYSIKYFEQVFPVSGLTKKQELYKTDGNQLIRQMEQTIHYPTVAGVGSHPRVVGRTIREYEVGGEANGTQIRTIVEGPTYSADGYVSEITQTITDAATPPNQWTSTTSFDLQSYLTPWCFGLPGLVTTTRTAPGHASQVRKLRHQFDSTNCSLSYTIDESDGNAAKQLKTTYTYDAYGNVHIIAQNNPNGTDQARSTTFGYDASGQYPLTITVGGVDLVTELTWNPFFGQQETAKSPDLLTTRWDYDNFGRVVKETRPVGHTNVAYEDCYACWPQRSRFAAHLQGSDGSDRYEFFDELRRPVGTSYTLPLGTHGRRETRYNGVGLVDKISRPYVDFDPVYWVAYQYDLLGRQVQENAPRSEGQPSGALTTYEYRADQTWVKDPLNRTTKYTRNAAGQISQVVDGLNGTTIYTYFPFGELHTVLDPESKQTTIEYDARGYKFTLNDPNTGLTTYDFNLYGELAGERNALTTAPTWTVRFLYDAAGRPDSRTEAEGITSYSYYSSGAGRKGRPYQILGPGHGETYDYWPAHGNLKSITRTLDGTPYTFDLDYDGQGRLDVLTYPESSPSYRFKVDYDFDSFGNLVVAKDGLTGASYYQLNEADALGREVLVHLGNGLDEYREFDRATGRLSLLETGASLGSGVQNMSFSWYDTGDLYTRTNSAIGKTETFTYDDLSRLKTTQVNGLTTVSMNYSAAGRIESKSDVGSYTYGDASHPHAVTTAGGASYAYDAVGRMVSRKGDTLTWHSFSLPKKLASGTKSAEFSYGVSRDRYKQVLKTGSTTDSTIYYVGTLFEKEVAATTTYRHHVSVAGRVIGIVSRVGITNSVQYLHRDQQNSVVEVTNASGSIVQSLAYDAWGLRRNASNWAPLTSPFAGTQPTERGYTGHEHLDTVELVHMNGRVQDPAIGRFISADPFIQAPFNAQSLNRYSYVWNNPTSLMDPSGFQTDDVASPFPTIVPLLENPVLATPEWCLGANHPSCDDRYANYDPETQRAVDCANGRGPCDMYATDDVGFLGVNWGLVRDSFGQMTPDHWRGSVRDAVDGALEFPLAGQFDTIGGVSDLIKAGVDATAGDWRGAAVIGATSRIPGGKAVREAAEKAGLRELAQRISDAGEHYFARVLRVVAVGRDKAGNLYAASSDRFTAAQRKLTDALGIQRVPSTPGNHAEENLLEAVDDLDGVGTYPQDPCPTCLPQLVERKVNVEN